MNKRDIIELIIAGLAFMAIIMVILVSVAILAPRERSGKAQKYDLDCSIQLKENPLQECKK